MPATRFPVMDLPRARPGACYVTGRSSLSAGPYVDTGMDIKGYGAVILSAGVVTEMYQEIQKHIGPADETLDEKSFREKIEEAEQRGFENALAQIKEKFSEFGDSFFTSLGIDLPDRSDDHPDFSVPDLVEDDRGAEGDKSEALSDDGNADATSGSEVDRRVPGNSGDAGKPSGIKL